MNIGINIKNNIIVYQEDIQAIASLNGKNLTNLFERISGSISFRRDYQTLLSQVEQARLDGKKSFNSKKELLTIQKRLRDVSKTNRISHGLQEDYVTLISITLVFFFCLFFTSISFKFICL